MEKLTEPTYSPTASKILDTATRLFMQLGYRAVSINDIVKAAGVTKPTLYYYFPDKEELFTQMALRRLAEAYAAMQAALSRQNDSAARLVAIADVLLDTSNGDMRLLRHEMHEHLAPDHQRRLGLAFYQRLFEPIHQVMQQGVQRGELNGYPADQLAWLFLSMMEAFHGLVLEHDDSSRPASADKIAIPMFRSDQIVGLFLHGVAGIEGAST
jgi:AcrR family transcriptional regulator